LAQRASAIVEPSDGLTSRREGSDGDPAPDEPEGSEERATAEETPTRWPWRHRRALAAFGGGAIAALATPPTDVFPAMFVGLALLAWAIDDAAANGCSLGRGLGLGLLWGTAGQLIGMRFVPSVITLFTDLGLGLALLAHLLLSAAQSLHWAIGMGLALVLRRRAPLPLAFGAGVMVALSLPSVFVWSPAGLLSPWPALVQGASLIGERGVSVLMAAASALLAMAFVAWQRGNRRELRLRLAAGAAIVAGLLVHGAFVLAAAEDGEDRARIALIHAGIDPKDRWDRKNWPAILATLKSETMRAELSGIDLSVWPEAAYPYPLPHDTPWAPRGARQIIGGALRGPVLFGFIAQDRPIKRDDGSWEVNSFNSATLVAPNGALSPSYDKMELLWFGETVPLGDRIPWLKRTFQRSGGLIAGRELRGLELARDGQSTLRMGVLNCYEDTLPGLGRRILNGVSPNLLVNVTNDAWFVGTQEPELHARLAAMRSIELRRDMVRAVNLGVSGWIDAWGRTRRASADREPSHLLVEPTLREGTTLYARLGDLPLWLALGLGLSVSFALAMRRRT
jgi:apolipoprotein N-acyltransferase